MKIAILSRAPRAYSTQRLRAAAIDRGHEVKVLNTLRFAIDLTGPEPDLNFRGRPLSSYDAILPRIGSSITYFGTAVVRQFEQMDVFTPNTANGISNARDKLRATQILSRAPRCKMAKALFCWISNSRRRYLPKVPLAM